MENLEFYTPLQDGPVPYTGWDVLVPRKDIWDDFIQIRMDQVVNELSAVFLPKKGDSSAGLLRSDGSRGPVEATAADGTIYNASGGLCLALAHTSRFLQSHPLGAKDAARQVGGAVAGGSSRLTKPDLPATLLEAYLVPLTMKRPEPDANRTKPQVGFYIGEPGLMAVAGALCTQVSQPFESKFKAVAAAMAEGVAKAIDVGRTGPTETVTSELLFGRAGFLYCISYLREHGIESKRLDQQAKMVVEQLLQQGNAVAVAGSFASQGWPLMWKWRGTAYLGAAHGVVGILYNLLAFVYMLTPQQVDSVKGTIAKLVSLVEEHEYRSLPVSAGGEPDSTVLHHWCHGLPGLIPLLTFAYNVFGEAKFLECAEKCAETIWAQGLLRKGLGLCHGVYGNAYAFLNLYRTSGGVKQQYLHWALEFVRLSSTPAYRASVSAYQDPQRRVQGIPDAPTSLMEGTAGELCFLVDLLRPEASYFPGYELPNNGVRALGHMAAVASLGALRCHPPFVGQFFPLLSSASRSTAASKKDREVIGDEAGFTLLRDLLPGSFCTELATSLVDSARQTPNIFKDIPGMEDASLTHSYSLDRIKYQPLLSHLVSVAQTVVEDHLQSALRGDLGDLDLGAHLWQYYARGEDPSFFHGESKIFGQVLRDEKFTRYPLVLKHAYAIEFRPNEVAVLQAHTDPTDVTLNISLRVPEKDRQPYDLSLKRPDGTSFEYQHAPGSAVIQLGDVVHSTTQVMSGSRVQLVLLLDFAPRPPAVPRIDTPRRVDSLEHQPSSEPPPPSLIESPPSLIEQLGLVDELYVRSGKAVPLFNLVDDVLGVVVGFLELADLATILRCHSRLHALSLDDDFWYQRYTSTPEVHKWFFPASCFVVTDPNSEYLGDSPEARGEVGGGSAEGLLPFKPPKNSTLCSHCAQSLLTDNFVENLDIDERINKFFPPYDSLRLKTEFRRPNTVVFCHTCSGFKHHDCVDDKCPKATTTGFTFLGDGLTRYRLPLLYDRDICPRPEQDRNAEDRAPIPWRRRLRVALKQARNYGSEMLDNDRPRERMYTGYFTNDMATICSPFQGPL